MKPLLTLLIFLFVACGGGGSGQSTTGDDDCLDTSTVTNGPNASNTDSFWDCNSDTGAFDVQFYDDGTGLSTAVGAFTWKETGCNQFEISDAFDDSVVDNIEGSVASGIFTFDQTFSNGTKIDVSCILFDL